MKRLSLRLSMVTAVLVLSGAAITHSVLTKRASAPAGDPVAEQADLADGDAKPVPMPIQAADADSSTPAVALQPPPASAFSRATPFKKVSHEAAIDADEPQPTVPADPHETGPFVPPADETAELAYSTYSEYDPTDTTDSFDPVPVVDARTAGAARQSDQSATAPQSDDTAAAPPVTSFPLAGEPPVATSIGPPPEPAGVTPPSSQPLSATAWPPTSAFPTAGDAIGPDADSGGSFSAAPQPPPAAVPVTTPSAAVAAAPEPARTPAAPSASVVPPTTLDDRTASTGLARDAGPPAYSSTPYEAGAQRSLAAPTPGSIPATTITPNAASLSAFTADVPGDRQLEGPQSPTIVIEKIAPDEVQVDQPATFQLVVRNVGNSLARHIVVSDQVPRGTEFISAVPDCTRTADGRLVWEIDALAANQEVVLALELLPKLAGEIGSVAQVSFQAQASVRTVCTQPQLALELTAPTQVLIGTSATLEIVVTNTGSGAARNVVLEEDVPEGFTHAAGRQLEHEIGTLRPQESRRLSLVLAAAQPGVYQNRLVVHGAGNLQEEDVREIEIAAPQLTVSMEGPALRYLDRPATYVIRMGNPGTAPARNIELAAYLPKGVQFINSDNHGQYDSQAHAVYWNLEELPAARQGDVHLTVLPIELGSHRLKAEGRGEAGLQNACEHEVTVEGLAGVTFTVSDVADPIEVGSDTAYEVRVANRGSKADTDIRVVAELPPGMVPTGGDGPVPAHVQGQTVSFDPVPRLAPGEEAVYKIGATGQRTGDHVIRVQVQSAELRVPVTKEEITRVYTDR